VLTRLARRQRFELGAVHVNHQISPNARRWAAFCAKICRSRRIALTTVDVTLPRGDSLEAAARDARYAVFRRLPADYVALAHNQDDQVETVLLQLLRGAGVKGLAGMPLIRNEGGRRKAEGGRERHATVSGSPRPSIIRPLLDVPRGEILKYAHGRRLRWIEDESNQNTYFVRNFLRHEILPRMGERFPAYRVTVARSARHLAEAAGLLDVLAESDGAPGIRNGTLEVRTLSRLADARARNVLRWFLSSHGVTMPGAERLGEALRQAVSARDDARVCVDLGEIELRRFAGALHVVPKAAAVQRAFARIWRGEPRLALPELGGTLAMSKQRGEGIDSVRLAGAPVTVRVRQSGERLRLFAGGSRRSLKNLMQEAKIPPWVRDRLPLLYCGDALVWVPDIGVDSAFRAQPGSFGIRAEWIRGSAGPA